MGMCSIRRPSVIRNAPPSCARPGKNYKKRSKTRPTTSPSSNCSMKARTRKRCITSDRSVYKRRLIGQQQRVGILLPAAERFSCRARRGGGPGLALPLVDLPDGIRDRPDDRRVQNRFLGRMICRDELDALADFLLKRQALEEQFVEIADAGLVSLLFLEFLSLDNIAHLFDHQ